jgi:hypothetical protein
MEQDKRMDKLMSFIQEMTCVPVSGARRQGQQTPKKPILDSSTMACFFSSLCPLSWAHECQSFVAALDSVISAADPDSAVGDHTGPQFLSTIGYRKNPQAKGALS